LFSLTLLTVVPYLTSYASAPSISDHTKTPLSTVKSSTKPKKVNVTSSDKGEANTLGELPPSPKALISTLNVL